MVASTIHRFKRNESIDSNTTGRDIVLRLRLGLVLHLVLQLCDSWSIINILCNLPSLQSTAIKAGTVIIVALANDLATTDDDSAVAIMKWRLSSLLETEGKIVVGLHVDS